MSNLLKKGRWFSSKHVLILIVTLVLTVYWGSWNGFFQQDEWAGLGRFYASGISLLDKLQNYYSSIFLNRGIGHFLPFTPAVNFLQYSLFGLNYASYAFLSLGLHISKSKTISLVAAVFFAVASSGSQAVLWVGTSIPTQMAAMFSILTIY